MAETKVVQRKRIVRQREKDRAVRQIVARSGFSLSTGGLWMCFVPQMYMQELTKQREMLYTVELVCHVLPPPPI